MKRPGTGVHTVTISYFIFNNTVCASVTQHTATQHTQSNEEIAEYMDEVKARVASRVPLPYSTFLVSNIYVENNDDDDTIFSWFI